MRRASPQVVGAALASLADLRVASSELYILLEALHDYAREEWLITELRDVRSAE